jgi:hypothetical protein
MCFLLVAANRDRRSAAAAEKTGIVFDSEQPILFSGMSRCVVRGGARSTVPGFVYSSSRGGAAAANGGTQFNGFRIARILP